MQQFEDRGYDVAYLSMDRNVAAYTDLKETILSESLDYYPHPRLLKELRELEKVGGKKIDHAPGGSKDLADAVAGVTHTLIATQGGLILQDIDVAVY